MKKIRIIPETGLIVGNDFSNYATMPNDIFIKTFFPHDASYCIVNEKDKARLVKLRKKHKNIIRNLWNPFDRNYEGVIGCNTVNRMYITPIGDVLVCPYVHIKIGNVYEQSLKEIRDYGFSIKHFNEYSPDCLAGEKTEFIQKFMSFEGQSIFKPAIAQEIFAEEDYVKS